MKNFVKAMDVNVNGFRHVQNRFCLEKSIAKLKAGIFIGSEICHLTKDLDSKHHLEHPAWESFIQVLENFVSNHRDMVTTLNLPVICFQLITRWDVACH